MTLVCQACRESETCIRNQLLRLNVPKEKGAETEGAESRRQEGLTKKEARFPVPLIL